jgi:hypothetical protein
MVPLAIPKNRPASLVVPPTFEVRTVGVPTRRPSDPACSRRRSCRAPYLPFAPR